MVQFATARKRMVAAKIRPAAYGMPCRKKSPAASGRFLRARISLRNPKLCANDAETASSCDKNEKARHDLKSWRAKSFPVGAWTTGAVGLRDSRCERLSWRTAATDCAGCVVVDNIQSGHQSLDIAGPRQGGRCGIGRPLLEVIAPISFELGAQ